MFDLEGNIIRKFGASGKKAGQFKSPEHVAFDSVGSALICDKLNHRIVVVKTDGSFVTEFGDERSMTAPHAVCIDGEGKIFVADGKGRVRVVAFE